MRTCFFSILYLSAEISSVPCQDSTSTLEQLVESVLRLAHTARILSLATEIRSSVVSEEKEFLACLILKIVISDKNLLYVFPAHSKFSSPATKIFAHSDKNRAVCARLSELGGLVQPTLTSFYAK